MNVALVMLSLDGHYYVTECDCGWTEAYRTVEQADEAAAFHHAADHADELLSPSPASASPKQTDSSDKESGVS